MRGFFIPLLITLAVLLLRPQPAHAATYTPGCTGTTGNSANLIANIAAANASAAADIINLTAGCTYTLSAANNTHATGDNGLPAIVSSATGGTLTINGNGATITRTGATKFHFFYIAPGGNLTVSNVTFTNGASNFGGAIINYGGALTVTNSTFSGNTAGIYGGALYNEVGGTLTVTGSTFTNNVVTTLLSNSEGGAIINIGTATITSSTFTNNSAALGGAIQAWNNSTTTIDSSTFTGGSATQGGVIYTGLTTTTRITSSTLSGNTAVQAGGAIRHAGGSLTIESSTISGNSITQLSGGGIYMSGASTLSILNSSIANNSSLDNGGGLYVYQGAATIAHSTVSGNTATNNVAGIYNIFGTVNLSHTIVAGNIAPLTPDLAGTFVSQGYNLIGNTSGVTGLVASDLKNISPAQLNLGALANNGGPTQTMALGSGSVAINAGNPAFTMPPDFDQRGAGYTRRFGSAIDIGAYEVQPACPTFPATIANLDTNGLIMAIHCANRTPTNEVINLVTGAGYVLTTIHSSYGGKTGLPTILNAATSGALTINGNGATLARSYEVSTPAFRVFAIDRGNLTLNDVTVSNGNDINISGGGIYNNGTLTINNSTFNANIGGFGGAIFNNDMLTVTGTQFIGNIGGNGGAIYNFGTVLLDTSILDINHSSSYGGGIYNFGTLTVSNTTFSSNSTTLNSFGYGGAIYQTGTGTMTMSNSTLVNNSAMRGAAIYNFSTVMSIRNSTIADNLATEAGGGLYTTSSTTLANTLVANNAAPTGADIHGDILSEGYNLIDNSSYASGFIASDRTDAAALPLNLGNLTNNGGGVRTMALLPGSVAINAGDPNYTSPLTTDQRGTGFARVRAGRIDIGAYEVQLTCPTFPTTISTGDNAGLMTAIHCANETPTNDVINLAVGGTYNLTVAEAFDVESSGLPTILRASTSGTLTINGFGALIVRSAGAAAFRILYVGAGGNLTLNGVTLANGSGVFGSGAYNDGTLTLNNSTISGNTATGALGGGIFNKATLTLTNSAITGNSATNGGGIYHHATALQLTITGSSISGNSAINYGGGLFNNGAVTISNSIFATNSSNLDGGAIENTGNLTITGSTFANNTTRNYGGAIDNFLSGTLTLSNSTFTQNTATNNGHGGAVYNNSSVPALIKNSTFVGNSATLDGGGLRCSAACTLANTIVAGNTAPTGTDINGAVMSQGYNLIGVISGASGLVASDLKNITPAQLNLGALANNGGLTQTMALLTGSVAIDAGNPGYVAPPTTDQRGAGYPRVRAGRIDIGAYEAPGPSSLTIQLSLPGRPTPPHASWVTTAAVELRPAIGAPIIAGNYTSNTNGRIVMTDLPMGSYTLWVNEVNSLGQSIAITLVAGANSITMPAMKAGDADGNNLVNVSDFAILAATFGKGSGTVGYDPRGDFDGNALVNVTDFSILAANFNQSGVP